MRAPRWLSLMLSAAAVGLCVGWTVPGHAAAKKFKIYLSMSYIGAANYFEEAMSNPYSFGFDKIWSASASASPFKSSNSKI
jgi:hypothetical protein